MFNLNKFIADSVTFRPVSMKYMINGWEDLICYREDGNNFKEYITHVVKEIINGNTNYETLVPWAIKRKLA